jgi:hypothetical protein
LHGQIRRDALHRRPKELLGSCKGCVSKVKSRRAEFLDRDRIWGCWLFTMRILCLAWDDQCLTSRSCRRYGLALLTRRRPPAAGFSTFLKLSGSPERRSRSVLPLQDDCLYDRMESREVLRPARYHKTSVDIACVACRQRKVKVSLVPPPAAHVGPCPNGWIYSAMDRGRLAIPAIDGLLIVSMMRNEAGIYRSSNASTKRNTRSKC